MSVNLLDLVKGQLTDAVVGKAASFLGESTEATQTGLTSAIPALLGGVMGKASSKSGATDLLGMITKPEVAGVLGNVGDLFGGSQSGSSLGANLLKGILGDKLAGVTDLIGGAAGFTNPGSASGLLKMAAPLLMGVVGKQVGTSGISGLMGLLSGQKEHLEAAAPSGFMDKIAGALGLGSFGALTSNLGSVASSLTGAVSGAVNNASDSVRGAADTVGDAANNVGTEVKKGGNKMMPIIGAIAALVAAFLLWKSCGSDVKDAATDVKDGVANTAGDVADGVKDGAAAVGDAVEGVAGDIYNAGADLVGKTVKGFEYLGEFASRKLKDGTELIIPNKGFEYQLVDFIEGDNEISKDAWFNLRRVLFKTGSADLDERSMSQIDNVAKILKAYPNVDLKIGGYTDNTGDAAKNKVLSAKRAEAVVNALVAKGIEKSRLTSEGYGIEHPVASNDTKEGQALNRRVAARVTKK